MVENNDTPDAQDSLIEYPSDFPIKVLGAQHPDFVPVLIEVVARHAPGFNPDTLEQRPSKGGNYLGLTFTIRATSREQLDALYRELSGHPMVKYVL